MEWLCDNCNEEKNTLYEGWFKTTAALNPFAVGTASASLIQHRRFCQSCTEQAIKLGLACAKELPNSNIKGDR